jgi:hypothetical protein
MRIGYTCTGARVSTSTGNWQGLVVDYLSKKAFNYYWDNVVEPIFKAAGSHVGTTLKYMETDSWECGGMNWTDDFAQEFKDYCGYDITNYLPVIGGYVVDDINTSNAFLADFRKVIAHAVATNHYAQFAERAHQHNMGIQPESAGPHAGPLDGITNYGHSDIAMSEFWSPSPHRPYSAFALFHQTGFFGSTYLRKTNCGCGIVYFHRTALGTMSCGIIRSPLLTTRFVRA